MTLTATNSAGTDSETLVIDVVAQDEIVYGDSNGDDQFDPGDVNTVIDWILGYGAMPEPGTRVFSATDVNGDGQVNPADVNIMIDYILGRIDRFPVEE